MANLNKVFLIGNLTRDPEVRYTPSGTAVGDIGLAVNRRYKKSDGEWGDETCFVNVTVWGRSAEACGEYLRKGSPLLVEGRLKFDQWERDGQKHNKLTVVAERTQFLGSPRGAEFRDAPNDESPTSSAPSTQPEGDSQPEADSQPAIPSTDDALSEDDDNLPF